MYIYIYIFFFFFFGGGGGGGSQSLYTYPYFGGGGHSHSILPVFQTKISYLLGLWIFSFEILKLISMLSLQHFLQV